VTDTFETRPSPHVTTPNLVVLDQTPWAYLGGLTYFGDSEATPLGLWDGGVADT